jgi:hypothetical protein
MPHLPLELRQYLTNAARRDFLYHCGLGLGSLALGAMQAQAAAPATSNPTAPRPPHFPAKAKGVIQLFMAGGPSQLELFDYKPKLQALHGKPVPQSYLEGKRFAFLKPNATLLGTKRKFAQHGASGAELSELLPHTAKIADDIAIVRTMHTDNFNHGPAKLIAQTGFQNFGAPTFGSWLLYGLGSESENLPGYVVLLSGPRGPRGGAYLWSNGFLPSHLQGTPLRSSGEPILNLANPAGVDAARQERTVQTIARLNALRHAVTGDDEIAARTASYELAFRMQTSAPELVDISDETQETLDLYGVKPGEWSFAHNVLLARRLIERGVRCVTLFHTDWDHHGGGENLEGYLDKLCRETDQPCSALVQDLKRRGMLDDTLVVWGGEFGRTPMGEVRATVGRDHHIDAYTIWLAGGGVRGGQTLGATDELGFYSEDGSDRHHVHDLHATTLHLMGLDHERLTFKHQGRNFKITDVAGEVIQPLVG